MFTTSTLLQLCQALCQSYGSQSYDVAIAIGPSQWHLKVPLSRWMRTWVQHQRKVSLLRPTLLLSCPINTTELVLHHQQQQQQCYVCEQAMRLLLAVATSYM